MDNRRKLGFKYNSNKYFLILVATFSYEIEPHVIKQCVLPGNYAQMLTNIDNWQRIDGTLR